MSDSSESLTVWVVWDPPPTKQNPITNAGSTIGRALSSIMAFTLTIP